MAAVREGSGLENQRLHAHTDAEVQRETREFHRFMTTVLQSYPDIAKRMAEFQNLNQPIAASVSSTSAVDGISRSRNTFEDVLLRTRVYRILNRNLSVERQGRASLSSASAWSQLSNRSLAEVTDVSMVRLPVYHAQLSNDHLYGRASEWNVSHLQSPAASSELEAVTTFENRSEASENLERNGGVSEPVTRATDDSETIQSLPIATIDNGLGH